MFPANAYVIRSADGADAGALSDLAQLDSQAPIGDAALIGEIDGRVAAAISLADGRVIADPFQATQELSALLKMRAQLLRTPERTTSLRRRILAGVRVTGVRPARA